MAHTSLLAGMCAIMKYVYRMHCAKRDVCARRKKTSVPLWCANPLRLKAFTLPCSKESLGYPLGTNGLDFLTREGENFSNASLKFKRLRLEPDHQLTRGSD